MPKWASPLRTGLAIRARCAASPDSRDTGEPRQRRQWPASQLPRNEDAEVVQPSNGEVEGPTDVAGRAQVERSSLVPARAADQAPRAHTVFRRPRRQTDHVSRTPRTIVRSHPHRSPLCACGTAPATEANLPPELSAPDGRTRTPVASNEDACKTSESATVRTPQSQPKHPPSSSRR